MTSLSVDAIRFYERTALLPKAPRTPGRFRLYSQADVESLSFIRRMQGIGFSLREVRQILDIRDNRPDPCKEVSELVKAKIREIRGKIVELRALERELSRGLRQCNEERGQKGAPGSCPVLRAQAR